MTASRSTAPRLLQRLTGGFVCVAAASLISAFSMDDEIAAGFMLGILAVSLCGSMLLIWLVGQSRECTVRGALRETPGGRSLDVNVLPSLSDLIGRPAVRVALTRQSATRLTGLATVSNPSCEPILLTGISIAHPAGARLAAAAEREDGRGGGPVTVKFESADSPLDLTVAPGATVRCRFYVLLAGQTARAQKTTLVLNIRRDDRAPTATRRAVSARIPT